MEQRYLIDTNVIIDAQIGKIPKAGMDFLANVVNTSFNVSFVSYIEFMGYKDIKPQSEAFIAMATIIEINKSIELNAHNSDFHKYEIPHEFEKSTPNFQYYLKCLPKSQIQLPFLLNNWVCN